MSAVEQLRWLARLFPRATEYAVSPELVDGFEGEMALHMRYINTVPLVPYVQSWEYFRGCRARRLPMMFRGVPLTLVHLT